MCSKCLPYIWMRENWTGAIDFQLYMIMTLTTALPLLFNFIFLCHRIVMALVRFSVHFQISLRGETNALLNPIDRLGIEFIICKVRTSESRQKTSTTGCSRSLKY
jgi:hypothetical protein